MLEPNQPVALRRLLVEIDNAEKLACNYKLTQFEDAVVDPYGTTIVFNPKEGKRAAKARVSISFHLMKPFVEMSPKTGLIAHIYFQHGLEKAAADLLMEEIDRLLVIEQERSARYFSEARFAVNSAHVALTTRPE